MDDAAGIYQVWLAGIDIPPTALAPSAGGFPDTAQLLQNYPNPFNPETTIEFTLNRAGNARVEVLDLLGRPVATLIDEPLPAGRHRVVWQAAGLASGVYICRLSGGRGVTSRKMLLLR